MKLIFVIIGIYSLLAFFGCSDRSKSSISSEKLRSEIYGIWQRTVIVDKEYVSLNYFFYKNKHITLVADTFRLSDPPPRIDYITGSWDIYTDSVLVINSTNSQHKFLWNGKTLSEIKNGEIISTEQDSIFQFKKLRWFPDLKTLNLKGIRVVAYGSNPSYWTLKLDRLNNFWFYVEGISKSFPLISKTSILKMTDKEFIIRNEADFYQLEVKGFRQDVRDSICNCDFPWKISLDYTDEGQKKTFDGGGFVFSDSKFPINQPKALK